MSGLEAPRMDEFEIEDDLRALERVAKLKASPARMGKVKNLVKEKQKAALSMNELVERSLNAGNVQPGVVDRHDSRIKDEGLTSADGAAPHRHTVETDSNGNGKTIWVVGDKPHEHQIKDGNILANTDGSDVHTHEGDDINY